MPFSFPPPHRAHGRAESFAMNLTEEEEEVNGTWSMMLRFQLRFAMEGVAIAIIAHLGIFGNVVSAYILLCKRLDLQPFLCRYE